MTVSAELLSILACPSPDHAPLRLETSSSGTVELICTVCASRFPVREGIPVLLADDATPGPCGLGQPTAAPGTTVAPGTTSVAEAPADLESDG